MHAHVSHDWADCDGRYSRTNVLTSNPGHDEWGFRAEVIGNVGAYADNGRMEFNSWGFTFDTPTDEGYVHTEVSWCTDDDMECAKARSTYRRES